MTFRAVFPLDLLMDTGMLLITQLAFGSFRPLRLLAAAAILSICTALALSLDLSPTCTLFMHLPAFLLGAQIATGARRPGRILEAAACMFCAGAAGAGFLMAGRRFALVTAITGAIFLLYLFRARRHENYSWNIEIYVEKDRLSASFPALIDTGNRLREHQGNLPVLIVEASAMRRIADRIKTLSSKEVQVLPFGVLGSSGEISCFQPDRVDIILPGRGRCAAPPCWIAVYPGRIPGSVRALAPPAFTKAFKTQGT